MQVVRALANPTRIRILDEISAGPSTPKELGARIGESPGVVAYHLRVLRATGCVRLSEDAPVGPAVERPYELAPTATPTRRLTPSPATHSGPGHPPASIVQAVLDRGKRHLGENLLGERKEQLSCASIVVDRQGWQEISAAIGEALDRISAAHEHSAERLSAGSEQGIEATVAVMTFESPGGRAA
ncbi:MAG TPA: winged helix-turn-helix domain-containing protein [Solirubrobacterales bacterium]|nr:winged helix-turn-helix domain-containing protein [Solirubrobacterales bacterium]